MTLGGVSLGLEDRATLRVRQRSTCQSYSALNNSDDQNIALKLMTQDHQSVRPN